MSGGPVGAGYVPPRWLPGGHLQTLYPLLIKQPPPAYRRERWDTPDGDFIDLDWLPESPEASPGLPLVVLFHGLEGDSRSHYAVALMRELHRLGWAGVVIHFRGCSGELNQRPRAYHSGDAAEIDWVRRRLRDRHPTRTLHVVGVSLGGNALLKWLGETGDDAQAVVDGAASVCAPIDLAACGHHLARGFNRLYTANFLRTLKARSQARLARYPGLFDGERAQRAMTLHAFDDAVTAPMHGFADADDYWRRASALPVLSDIRVPTLLVQATNDPFLPPSVLASIGKLTPSVVPEFTHGGGHVGFVSGPFPGHLGWLPRRLLQFFQTHR